MQGNQSTVDPAEVAKFEAMAAEWWDLEGKFKPLHMLNPCRLDYISQQIASEFGRNLKEALPFQGLRILDIGCGGGLLCEPMARLGADVVGADAAKNNIPVAKSMPPQSGLDDRLPAHHRRGDGRSRRTVRRRHKHGSSRARRTTRKAYLDRLPAVANVPAGYTCVRRSTGTRKAFAMRNCWGRVGHAMAAKGHPRMDQVHQRQTSFVIY